MRDMVGMTLRGAGHSVVEAAEGNAGLRALSSGRFDIVITDLNMPGMDGLSMIKAIRSTPGHRAVPIIVLTTESSDEKRAEAKEAGATGWIVKPFSPKKLVEIVDKLCP
jgi:two-component system chemotaxis response regulator CheY